MKTLKLLNLRLHNFKGIKNFQLDAHGESLKVFGDNATGKTTVFDAFVWLLFDKDSNNKKDFQIKTVDANGNELHNLNHEVEGVFLLNGEELTLKKVYKEKWTKKRGSAHQEFTGHTTDYYIDGVPVKKKEYEEKVAEIINEDVFKLLTSPSYFNEQLHWKDRRDTLLEIAGDVSDEEVIENNPSLAKLADILGKRSIDDHKKVIAAKRKEINEELERIPIRIDEIHRNMPDITGLDKEDLEKKIAHISNKISEKQEKINDLKNGSEINNIKKQISDIDLQLNELKFEHEQQGQNEIYKLQIAKQEEDSNIKIIKSKISNLKEQIDNYQGRIKSYEDEMNRLRDEWKQVNDEPFEHDEECVCPACGQDLPEEQIEEARKHHEQQFNKLKAKKLERISNEGKALKAKVEQLTVQISNYQDEIKLLEADLLKKEKRIKHLEEQTEKLSSNLTDVTETDKYKALVAQKEELQQKIEDLQQSVQGEIFNIQAEINELNAELEQLRNQLSEIKTAERSKARIAELEQQEKDLAQQFEQLEEELYLTEEFIRTKVNMLESKINSKFRYARFKLFKENINGGFEEVCETLYNGVPYSSGLNNAAKINVGLDIINTLSEHYKFSAPIFIDNAESVTKLIDIDSQVISLVVSEKDKTLRVESPNKKESVVA